MNLLSSDLLRLIFLELDDLDLERFYYLYQDAFSHFDIWVLKLVKLTKRSREEILELWNFLSGSNYHIYLQISYFYRASRDLDLEISEDDLIEKLENSRKYYNISDTRALLKIAAIKNYSQIMSTYKLLISSSTYEVFQFIALAYHGKIEEIKKQFPDGLGDLQSPRTLYLSEFLKMLPIIEDPIYQWIVENTHHTLIAGIHITDPVFLIHLYNKKRELFNNLYKDSEPLIERIGLVPFLWTKICEDKKIIS